VLGCSLVWPPDATTASTVRLRPTRRKPNRHYPRIASSLIYIYIEFIVDVFKMAAPEVVELARRLLDASGAVQA
jgi:hypothetical protein